MDKKSSNKESSDQSALGRIYKESSDKTALGRGDKES